MSYFSLRANFANKICLNKKEKKEKKRKSACFLLLKLPNKCLEFDHYWENDNHPYSILH